MKRYEFHSALLPEEVFARLEANTRHGRQYNYWALEEFISARKGGRFRLGYTGIVPARGFVPFHGTVRAEGTGSVIAGGFSLLREMGALCAIAGGVFWITGICSGQPPLSFLVLTVAWLLVVLGFFSVIQLIFFWNRRKLILKLIQDKLLK